MRELGWNALYALLSNEMVKSMATINLQMLDLPLTLYKLLLVATHLNLVDRLGLIV